MLENYLQPLELTNVSKALDTFLKTYMSDFWAYLIEFVIAGIAILATYAIIALALIYIERKIVAFFQARLGPNRLGKYGWIQSIADMVKILIKEIMYQRYHR